MVSVSHGMDIIWRIEFLQQFSTQAGELPLRRTPDI
jgi:hypothetical protein